MCAESLLTYCVCIMMGIPVKELFFAIVMFISVVSAEFDQLHLTVTNPNPKRVSILMEGLDSSNIEYCEGSYHSSNHTEWIVIKYIKSENNTIILDKLSPQTQYGFYIQCDGTDQIKYKSSILNFTTGSDKPSTPAVPAIGTLSSSLATDVPFAATTTHPLEKVPSDQHTPTRDIWLGIALGLLSVGGFICGGYYVVREYRRRMRIRRFLQYRQQENETFPDIDQDEDEGIVI